MRRPPGEDSQVAWRAAIQTGHDALTRAEWEDAKRAFGRALSIEDTPEALEGLGMAAWWLDDAPTVFAARERAYRLFRKRADRRGAARLAITIAQDFFQFRGHAAIARGWIARAHRLLDGLATVPEHGWLRVWEGDFLLKMGDDPRRVRALGAEAAEIGRRLDELDLEMTALALEGLALVSEGALTEGMARLDEATTAAVCGEMTDPFAIGISCCYLVDACERIRDFDRAAQWCARVKEIAERTRFNALRGICRAQYASVLVWRGEWTEAEAELQGAARDLGASRPALQVEALLRLADLRRRQGRFDEARSLLSQIETHPQALVGRAALALGTGDFRAAAHLAERFLRNAPASALTDRIYALDVLYRARLALGQRNETAHILEALCGAAACIGTAPVRACARAVDGLARAADGDYERARRAFEDAVDLYGKSGARYERACARLELANVLFAVGERRSADVELEEAHRTFRELGARWRPEQAVALKAEAEAGASRSTLPRSLTRREIEVLKLAAAGLSNRAIGQRLFVSDLTVKRHVGNILSKLDLPSRAAAAAYAAKTGLL